MVESPSHLAYKRVAIDLLKDRGFSPGEIHQEYAVTHKVNGKVQYKVDIVGIKKDYKIAVECGGIKISKLMDLRKIFNDVIIVNAEKVVDLYDHWRGKYIIDREYFETQINYLRENLDSATERCKSKLGRLSEKTEKLDAENRKLKLKVRTYQKVIAESCEAMKEPS